VNVKAFKPASTNKIALLLPLNGQAAVFGRTIQQGFEAAKNIGTQPVAAQVAAAPAADVAEQPQPPTVEGGSRPAHASVSHQTGDTPAGQPVPVPSPTLTRPHPPPPPTPRRRRIQRKKKQGKEKERTTERAK
ncbi:penicillin-binding protein activator, partial [Escherichia coli]|uniref:penicillin-binding protein activator n=1 Tax=Escherichia coli TaxID=562 RepID=UPI002025A1FE